MQFQTLDNVSGTYTPVSAADIKREHEQFKEYFATFVRQFLGKDTRGGQAWQPAAADSRYGATA